jgi:hypothetical protein
MIRRIANPPVAEFYGRYPDVRGSNRGIPRADRLDP